MEGIFQRQYLEALEGIGSVVFAGIGTREFHRAFNRLGAGISEKYAIEPRKTGQLLCQRTLIPVIDQVGDMQQRLRGVAQGSHDLRVRVTQGIHCQSSEKIQILLPAVVVQITAIAGYRQNGQPVISRNQEAIFEFGDLIEIHRHP